MKVYPLVCILLLTGCRAFMPEMFHAPRLTDEEKYMILIKGQAIDAKAGAAIAAKDESVFYFEGKNNWRADILGQTVEVLGDRIDTVRTKLVEQDSIQIQGVEVKMVIKSPQLISVSR